MDKYSLVKEFDYFDEKNPVGINQSNCVNKSTVSHSEENILILCWGLISV